MAVKILKRNILQRLFGISATRVPVDLGCWTYARGKLVIDLERAPELSKPGGGIRIEGQSLPARVLVIHGDDGRYHAFRNRCQHMGRRLDPVPGTTTVQCCSVSKSTYGYDGAVVYGPAKESVTTYPVQQEARKLVISL
jgi:nitrite reductase/ring-hydroxylating ferredoxin subunit